MALAWGDPVMVLNQLYNGEYYDIPGQYRGPCLMGRYKGTFLVALMGAKDNFHIPTERLCSVEEYFKRKHAGQQLPAGACGRLITDSPVESEGARGNLLAQILVPVTKAEDEVRGVTGEGDKENEKS